MNPLISKIYLICLGLVVHIVQINAQSIGVYAFGHSLIDHRPPATATPSDETTVFFWMQRLADFSGKEFSAGGQYGFLPNHDNLPPRAQWGYLDVNTVWDEESESFSQSKINTILLTAGNFIQYVPVNEPHPVDNSTSVLESTQTIFDWVDAQKGECSYYIYANWPEMDLRQAYPPNLPSSDELQQYFQYTENDFMNWWIDYQDQMIATRPDYNVRLIPVGTILSKLINGPLKDKIPFTELYEDSAPHGRPNVYFLSALVTYMAMTQEKLPEGFDPGDQIHVGISSNLDDIITFIWQELLAFNDDEGQSRVFHSNITSSPKAKSIGVYIYPNPAANRLIIQSEISIDAIVIRDMMGREVGHKNILKNKWSEVDLSHLPQGTYLISVINKNQEIRIQKYICKW